MEPDANVPIRYLGVILFHPAQAPWKIKIHIITYFENMAYICREIPHAAVDIKLIYMNLG